MPNLIVLVGAPASGKSTRANQLETQGYVRVSQDDQGQEYKSVFANALKEQKNIVVDRMNFNKEQRGRFILPAKEAGYKIEIGIFHVPYAQSFRHGLARKDHPTISSPVTLESALHTFYTRYEKPDKEEADAIYHIGHGVKTDYALVVDLDGTLCDTTHRQSFGKEKNWKEFFGRMFHDPVNYFVLNTIEAFRAQGTREIVFCSGRPEEYRATTEEWLKSHNIKYDHLFMRKKGDFRSDVIVKEIILDFELKTRYGNMIMLDDRNSVVEMWRRNGYPCLQVAEGDF